MQTPKKKKNLLFHTLFLWVKRIIILLVSTLLILGVTWILFSHKVNESEILQDNLTHSEQLQQGDSFHYFLEALHTYMDITFHQKGGVFHATN